MYLAVTAYRDGRRPPQPAVEEHWRYLDARYAERRLLCSGPQDSGTGGVLVVLAEDEASARASHGRQTRSCGRATSVTR